MNILKTIWPLAQATIIDRLATRWLRFPDAQMQLWSKRYAIPLAALKTLNDEMIEAAVDNVKRLKV